jgi:hypothetical protein
MSSIFSEAVPSIAQAAKAILTDIKQRYLWSYWWPTGKLVVLVQVEVQNGKTGAAAKARTAGRSFQGNQSWGVPRVVQLSELGSRRADSGGRCQCYCSPSF